MRGKEDRAGSHVSFGDALRAVTRSRVTKSLRHEVVDPDLPWRRDTTYAVAALAHLERVVA